MNKPILSSVSQKLAWEDTACWAVLRCIVVMTLQGLV